MILESLLDLVNELKLRIGEHESQLRSNERQTRYALIDPLLRELGWDTSDPSLVTPEIPASGGRADYALLDGGKPVVMVEAKRLGESLQGAVSQGIQYCLERGTKHFAVTDGQHWEVYETHRPVPIEQKKVVSFDIVKDATGTVCLEALALWRPTVLEDKVRSGRKSVVDMAVGSPPPPPVQPTALNLKPLDVSSLTKNSKGMNIRPDAVVFPDKSTAQVQYWWEVTFSIAKWLVDSHHLTESHCPVTTSTGNKYLIAASPLQPNGNQMYNPKPVGDFHIEVHRDALTSVRNAKAIIQHVGQDPSQFRLRFP